MPLFLTMSSKHLVDYTYWDRGLPYKKHRLTPSKTDRIKIKNTVLIMPYATCLFKRIKMCRRIAYRLVEFIENKIPQPLSARYPLTI